MGFLQNSRKEIFFEGRRWGPTARVLVLFYLLEKTHADGIRIGCLWN